MKNLQKNNPTIGAQSFKLADRAGEDIYIYEETKSLIYNLDQVNLWIRYNGRRTGTEFVFSSNQSGDLRIKQGDNLSTQIIPSMGGDVNPHMPIDLYQPFYLGLLGEDSQTFTPLIRFYNFNEDNFIHGGQPKIEFEEFYPSGIQIYPGTGMNYVDYTSDSIGLENGSYTDILRGSDSKFYIELTFKPK